MASIGDIFVKLKLDAQPFIESLKDGQGKLEAFAASVKNLSTTIGPGLAEAFKNPAKVFTTLLSTVGDLFSRIPVVGGLLAAPFELAAAAGNFLIDTFQQGSQAILDMGRAAARAQVSIRELQVVTYLFDP